MLSELQALTEALAARLERAVAIDDRSMRLLAHSAHHGPVDDVRLESILRLQASPEVVGHVRSLGLFNATAEVVRVDPQPELHLLARACAPLRAAGELLGFLWLVDAEHSLTESDLAVVAETARSAALVLHRDQLLGDLQAGRQRELLRDLLGDDRELREAAAESLRAVDRAYRGRVRALVVRLPDENRPYEEESVSLLTRAIDRASRGSVPTGCLHLVRADHALVIVPLTERIRETSSDLVNAIRVEVSRSLRLAVRTGLGESVDQLSEVIASYEQARKALHVAEVVPGFGDDVNWSDLGVYRLLVHIPLTELSTDAVPPTMLSLFETRNGQELLRTVETYLDRAADIQSSCDLLSVHRTTLYYRLGRFYELTGLDLKDGGDRLAVHLGLKMARLLSSSSDTVRLP